MATGKAKGPIRRARFTTAAKVTTTMRVSNVARPTVKGCNRSATLALATLARPSASVPGARRPSQALGIRRDSAALATSLL
jgi:hypothetical protein